jgi:NADH-quinone oxidoreductase subunit E
MVINTVQLYPINYQPVLFFLNLFTKFFRSDFRLVQIASQDSQNYFSDMAGSIVSIIDKYAPRDKSNLIAILQQVQKAEGYITPEAVTGISNHLSISRSQIFGVASFYSQFKFNPPGRNSIKICLGTACHVQGGDFLLNALRSEIGISPNETTADGRFDLERVACLGCCALAPVVMVNDDIFSNMSVVRLKEILNRYD